MLNEAGVPNDSNYIRSPLCDGTMLVEVREGSTLIAQRVLYRPTGLQTYIYQLSAGEAAAVSNWSNLAVWLTVYDSNSTIKTAKVALGTLTTPAAGDVKLYLRARIV